ncbi:MAG: hypothetical protein DLM61_18855 [Pseudonocardiales bacterium]|nr:MAG: hypothetical protein DLM61_18855 [Pseudonocardiales bacterium]
MPDTADRGTFTSSAATAAHAATADPAATPGPAPSDDARTTVETGGSVTATRRWRWVPVLLGAAIVSAAGDPVAALPFYATPLILGVTYLGAPAMGGRGATLWAPGLVITAWGAAVVLVFSHTLDADFTAVAVTALGAGRPDRRCWATLGSAWTPSRSRCRFCSPVSSSSPPRPG